MSARLHCKVILFPFVTGKYFVMLSSKSMKRSHFLLNFPFIHPCTSVWICRSLFYSLDYNPLISSCMLMLKLSLIWQLRTLFSWLSCPLACPLCSLSTFLFSGIAKYSRLSLYFPFTSLESTISPRKSDSH